MRYEYLVLKKNRENLIYDKMVFSNSKDARKHFKRGDILLKCKENSIFFADNWQGWSVKTEDIIKKYFK